MDKIICDKKTLRGFGMSIGIVFLVITIFILIKQRHIALAASIISATFFISAIAMPLILKPVYIIWMKITAVLGWINARIILFLIFYLVFTSIGLIIKLLGKDLLDRKIKKEATTYWRKKEKTIFNPVDYKRQF